MKKLNVIYNGWGKAIHYGTLAEKDKMIYFEYTPEALKSNIQLSPIQTPLSAGLFHGFPSHQDNLPGFIADSLPDGWGLPSRERPKAMVRYNTQKNHISTEATATGEDWLVKFPAKQEHFEVCAIEQVYSNLARDIGIAIPPTQYFRLDKKYSAFAIKRFDRTVEGLRIPVLTVAGALDLDFRVPNFDYRDLLRLTRAITNNIQQVYAMLLRIIFNIVFNNRDDHTKNFSFMMNENQQCHISPAYDLTFNEGPNGYHQMAVMGEAKNPTKQDVIKLITDSALDNNRCNQLIDTVITAALTFKQQALHHGDIRKQTISGIDKKIRNNISLFTYSFGRYNTPIKNNLHKQKTQSIN